MPTLQVVPHDILTMLKDEGESLSCLKDTTQLVQVFAANDLAELQLAHARFPFRFDRELNLDFGISPVSRLALEESHQDILRRVKAQLETLDLQQHSNQQRCLSQYTLYPVDESLWVAAEQRLCNFTGDPDRGLLSLNRAFFDALVEQSLHTLSFEQVCRTNLFTYYLDCLPVDAA